MYDEVIAAALVARRIARLADQGYGAAIINCFMDPGLNTARELATIPVVGAGESAIRVALTVGQRFSIIDVGSMKYILRSPTRQIRSMGLGSRFASIRGIGIPVLKLNEQQDLTVKKIAREAKLAITADGADVIVLGCTGLARLNERIRLRVPIVEPSLSALNGGDADPIGSKAQRLSALAIGRRPVIALSPESKRSYSRACWMNTPAVRTAMTFTAFPRPQMTRCRRVYRLAYSRI